MTDPTNPPRPTRIALDQKSHPDSRPSPKPSRLDASSTKVAMQAIEEGFNGAASVSDADVLLPRRRGWSLTAWGLGLLASFLVLVVGADAVLKLRGLFGATPWLGWAGLGLLVAGLSLLLLMIGREWWLARMLHRHQTARHQIDLSLETGDTRAMARGLHQIERRLAHRADLAHAQESFALTQQNAYTEAEQLALYEQIVLQGLDQRAVRAIRAASVSSAWLTAISPFAVLDVSLSLWRSLKLLREISALYGGPQSAFSSLRLLRLVFRNLFIAGSLGAGDSLLQNILGGGLAGKISAKLSEGTINGLMTARVGLAAMTLLRPLPFQVVPAPTLTQLATDLANDLRTKALGA